MPQIKEQQSHTESLLHRRREEAKFQAESSLLQISIKELRAIPQPASLAMDVVKHTLSYATLPTALARPPVNQ